MQADYALFGALACLMVLSIVLSGVLFVVIVTGPRR